MDIRRFLQRCFERFPEETALESGSRSLTFKELEDRVLNISRKLDALDLQKGSTAALFTENNFDSLLLILGCWYSGVRIAEVKPKTSSENISYFLDDSEANTVFYSKELEEKIEKADLGSRQTVKIENIGSLPEGEISDLEKMDDEIASISYTSGTTGTPKGVPYTHDRLLHNVLVLLIRNEVKEEDVVCLIYPYYGVGTLELLASLSSGAKVVLPGESSPQNILKTVEEKEVTSIGGVPTQLKSLAEETSEQDYDLSSLRYVHTGSGIMTENVYEMIKEELCMNICTSYGSSEAGETLYHLGDSISIGRPTRFQRVRLIEEGSKDPENIVEGSGSGELIVSMDGPQVFDGYWNKPEKTSEVVRDGWYFTEDIVYRDEEGKYWFRGRNDDMIISGGVKISPVEVEDTLLSHSKVKEAGVVGIEDEKWGEKVVVFVETEGEISDEELDKHCRQSDLENFKRPKEYIFTDKLPLNKTGGVERKKLRDSY